MIVVVLLSITCTCTDYQVEGQWLSQGQRCYVVWEFYLSWPLLSYYAYCMCSTSYDTCILLQKLVSNFCGKKINKTIIPITKLRTARSIVFLW